jgi:DNA-binding NarL/FixJ family response regulator
MMIIRRDWTPREDAILQQGALTGQTVGEIARMVGRTMSAVLTRARNRQIKLKRRSTSESLSAPALVA